MVNKPSTDGRENKSVIFQEYTEENDVKPTRILDPTIFTGSVAVKALAENESPVYIGWDEDVTPDNGFPLYVQEGISFDLDGRSQGIYAVTETSGNELRVISSN